MELERAVALAQGNTLWLGQLGGAYAMAGRTSDAQATLRALEERARTSYVSPQSLHGHPRFRALLRQMKLA